MYFDFKGREFGCLFENAIQNNLNNTLAIILYTNFILMCQTEQHPKQTQMPDGELQYSNTH